MSAVQAAPRLADLSSAARDKVASRRHVLEEYRRWYATFQPFPDEHPDYFIPVRSAPRTGKADLEQAAMRRELARFAHDHGLR